MLLKLNWSIDGLSLMPLLYPVKRVFRSWKLFLALLVEIMLASTFFAGINIKTNLAVRQVLDERLTGIYTDMQFNAFLNYSYPAAANLLCLETFIYRYDIAMLERHG